MLKICTLLLIIFSSMSSAAAANKNTLSLESYIKFYFNQSEVKKNIDLDLKSNLSKSDSLNNNYDGNFSVTPSRNQQKDLLLNTTWNKQDQVTAAYKQNLPTGTSITLGGTKQLNNDPLINIVDNSYFVRLEQDLWRNGLGFNQRSFAKTAKLNKKASQLNHSISLAKECNQAISLYIEAYKAQVTYDIIKKLNKNSTQTLNSTRRSYRQKLTRKIDFISAEADHLNNERKLLNSEINYANNIKALKTSIPNNISKTLTLKAPTTNINTPIQTELSNKYEMAYNKNTEAKELNYKVSKNLKQPDVKLFIEGSQEDNQFITNTNTVDAKNVNVGININIPINDKSLSSTSKQEYYEWQKSENEKKYEIRKLKNELANLITQNKTYDKQLIVIEKQKKLYKTQTSEAKKLLTSGRIEYKDYTQYRDLELNNELNWIDIYKNKLTTLISISLLNDPNSNFCLKAL